MERLDELKAKYASVLDLVKKQGIHLTHLHVQDDKLFMQGTAPSDAIKNKLWDQIKVVDPSYGDLICDISIDPSLPQPEPEVRKYTVVAGDSLWKISQHFYGNGAQFHKIIEANPGKLKDEHSVIHPGDELVVP